MQRLNENSWNRPFKLSLMMFAIWTVVYALFAWLLSSSKFMTAEVVGMIQLQLFGAWAFLACLAGLFYYLGHTKRMGLGGINP